MTLEERHNRVDLMQLFRISKGLSAISLESFIELDSLGSNGAFSKVKEKKISYRHQEIFLHHRGLSIVGICSMRVWFRQGPLMLLRKDYGSFVKQRKAA